MTAIPADSFCLLCPDRERLPYRGLVCESCRRWLASMIGDVRAYAAELSAMPDLVPDYRPTPVVVIEREHKVRDKETGKLREWGKEIGRHALRDDRGRLVLRVRDQISALIPSGSAGAVFTGGPVSGSKNPPVPISVDAVDILMPASQGSVRDTLVPATALMPPTSIDGGDAEYRRIRITERQVRHPVTQELLRTEHDIEYVSEAAIGQSRQTVLDGAGRTVMVHAGDQVGHLSLAAVLDSWVREWRELRDVGEGIPDAKVDDMCAWLHTRVDWACDSFEPIAVFTDEIRSYRTTMAALLGALDIPDYKTGVACPKCEARALFRRYVDTRDGSLWVECGECPAILSPDEYADHVRLSAAVARNAA